MLIKSSSKCRRYLQMKEIHVLIIPTPFNERSGVCSFCIIIGHYFQITYRKLIQWVSLAVGLFMPIFTTKQGDSPNFATQNIKHTTVYCGAHVCLKIETTIFCGLPSLNYRNSLKYRCYSKIGKPRLRLGDSCNDRRYMVESIINSCFGG